MAAVVLAVVAAVREPRRRDRTVWLLVAVAMVFRTEGDAAWWWLEAVRGRAPFPSVADLGYLGFYPLMIGALVLLPVRSQGRRAAMASVLDVVALTGGALVVIWYLDLGAALQKGITGLEQVLNVAYPVGDLLLVVVGGRLLLRGVDPRWARRATLLMGGALFAVIADVGFGHQSTLDGVAGGGWIDLVGIGGLLFPALAASSQAPTGKATPGAVQRHAHLLPVLAIVAGVVVVAIVGLQLPLFPAGAVLLMNVVITVVVVARQVVTVTEYRDLAERYRLGAITDALTEVSSRSHFLHQAEELLSGHRSVQVAVVMIDVDHFKTINDLHGHSAGDGALKAVGKHLRDTLREGDLLARFGGDEFVAVLVDVDLDHAARIIDRLTTITVTVGHTHPVTLSIGWATQGESLTRLLDQADTAMYAAKEAGRGRALGIHQLTRPLHPATPPTSASNVTGRPTPA